MIYFKGEIQGAIYAAEKFSTCSQVVENAKQISITFPPPNISPNCGTKIKVGYLKIDIARFLSYYNLPKGLHLGWKARGFGCR